MKRHLLVAGTGKTGRNSGLYFLGRGWRVTWLSRDPGRRDVLALRIARETRRLEAAEPGSGFADAAQVLLLDDAEDLGRLDPDLFLEAVGEDLAQKRDVFRRVVPHLTRETLLVTNSSSILPGDIHPRCLGAHCFFPLEISRLVEAVIPRGVDDRRAGDLHNILQGVGLRTIVQSAANAFAVNRLLLPLQAEAVRALRAGWPVAVVDDASSTPLVPFGQLALMDAVGLDVIAPAVANYRGRMPPAEAQDYAELSETLHDQLVSGKRGRKNRDGFLAGAPLPWLARTVSREDAGELKRDFSALAVNCCTRAIERGDIDPLDLSLAFSALFATTVSLDEERRRGLDAGLLERLVRQQRASGRTYFQPALRFRGEEAAR